MNDFDREQGSGGEQQTQPPKQSPPPPIYSGPGKKPPPSGGYQTYYRTTYGGGQSGQNPNSNPNPNGYRPYSSNAGGRGQQPYQYSSSNGWQQQPGDRYEWRFEEYDSAAKKPRGKNRGLVVFAVALLCVMSVALLALTGYNIILAISDPPDAGQTAPGGETTQTPELPPASSAPSGGGGTGSEISMNIAGKPQLVESMPPVGEKMTIPQVAQSVRPSVVGVVNYQNTTFYEPTTEGSGIILSTDGYIVTNAHVVADADAVVIVFDDDTEFEATLIGSDARTDLAVLKVDRTGLSPATFGNSNELVVGEPVIAIGNPGGVELAGSVTQGIVSAVNRVVKNAYYSTNYIQTDAAISPGNSGGALCNEYGQVVGINAAKIAAEGYEGISFAIPISEAVPIIDDLVKYGRVTGRVLLGITGDNVSEVIARNRNIPAGVQITGITSEELTSRGVLRGDIITHIDDVRIVNMNDLRNELEKHKAGDVVKLTLFRQTRVTQNDTFDVEVRLYEDAGE